MTKLKSGSSKIQEIENKFGKDFGIRSKKKLYKLLEARGYHALSKLLKND